MSKQYPEYKHLSLPELEKEVLKFWDAHDTFAKSVSTREGKPSFTFYEGPPSANGKPGIHHVISRAIKDIFCRYKTLQGFQVKRKGGWDTHGLPVELQVEKAMGITKADIGTKISIKDYNAACKEDVLKYKHLWDDITRKMGYWVDLSDPYITFESNYIESVWNLLKRLWDKGYLYKGFTIQPYSPAAGTGLSSHELNQPGTYQEVKDTSAIAQFKVKGTENEYFLAWTTTPWTLPSNTALTVGKNITYVKVRTFNRYTQQPAIVILAKDRLTKYFSEQKADLQPEEVKPGSKPIPYIEIVAEVKGSELAGMEYDQLMPYVQPNKPAFRVIIGDFVTTEDGTGIVHTAPTFGADDFKVAQQNGIPPIMVEDEEGNPIPLVDKRGRFVKEVTDFAGRYVKDYGQEEERSVDEDISIMLKKADRAFLVEKYVHTYPHCWRTDKPVLYYPLDSWFVKTTAVKDRLIELNNTINWKPASTGSGRFGNWLENLVDWNLSRSRYWGIPLPVWRTEDGSESICIGSVEELSGEMDKAVAAGLMKADFVKNFLEDLDLHKPGVDNIVLVSKNGQPMHREPDLIDVWFDSGSMPFAQWHYPFENQETFIANFPADFIAEGVDQTRGWFFTLHAIAVMLEDSVAYKNVIANGLIQDKNGNKMSKRIGNVVDPFEMIESNGADAVRWYMLGNTSPWENLRFNPAGVQEVKRKYFGTLYNTYNGFFATYANIDGFTYGERIPVSERRELDQWIISVLNSLVKTVQTSMDDYEATPAIRAIDYFVNEQLSNWYVRLSRRIFWKGEMNKEKEAAYQTLYECLHTVAVLMSPYAPFFSDRLYRDLSAGESVHLANFPEINEAEIDLSLEERMEMAQRLTSMILSIRKKEKLKVRQPLQKAMVAVLGKDMHEQLDRVQAIIAAEVNVKEINYITGDNAVLVKKVKPNFRLLGPKLGKLIKELGPALAKLTQAEIRQLEAEGELQVQLSEPITLTSNELEVVSEDIPGWAVASDGKYTVALDLSLTEDLKQEGIARELVNRIQNLRKDKGFDVTDKIEIQLVKNEAWDEAVESFSQYIQQETLAQNLAVVEGIPYGDAIEIENVQGTIALAKV